jgi:hypothetical protein
MLLPPGQDRISLSPYKNVRLEPLASSLRVQFQVCRLIEQAKLYVLHPACRCRRTY